MASRSFESIKRKSDFTKLRDSGRRIFGSDWLMLSVKPNDLEKTRLGLTISKKIGTAVIRNKLKRWCRECLQHELQEQKLGVDINVVFRGWDKEFFKDLQYGDFQKAFTVGWKKIKKVH